MVQHCTAQLYWFLLHRIALQCILYCSAQNFDFYCIVLHCNVFFIVLYRIARRGIVHCILHNIVQCNAKCNAAIYCIYAMLQLFRGGCEGNQAANWEITFVPFQIYSFWWHHLHQHCHLHRHRHHHHHHHHRSRHQYFRCQVHPMRPLITT